jgi:hypothetical protein
MKQTIRFGNESVVGSAWEHRFVALIAIDAVMEAGRQDSQLPIIVYCRDWKT